MWTIGRLFEHKYIYGGGDIRRPIRGQFIAKKQLKEIIRRTRMKRSHSIKLRWIKFSRLIFFDIDISGWNRPFPETKSTFRIKNCGCTKAKRNEILFPHFSAQALSHASDYSISLRVTVCVKVSRICSAYCCRWRNNLVLLTSVRGCESSMNPKVSLLSSMRNSFACNRTLLH